MLIRAFLLVRTTTGYSSNQSTILSTTAFRIELSSKR
nr:MAG TPA: hypothetical protein [Crassvirales sp.]